MAVDSGTASALNALNNILSQNLQSREASKDRGLRIAGMKIASDEKELDRLNTYVTGLEEENRQMEANFTAMSGAQRALTKLEEKSGIYDTNAQGIVEKGKATLVADHEGLQGRLGEAKARRRNVLGDIASYSNVINTEAPEAYDQYRGRDYEVDATEWKQMIKDKGIDLETRDGKLEAAALRKAFTSLEEEGFGREMEGRKFGVSQQTADASTLRADTDAWYKAGLLTQAQEQFEYSISGDKTASPDITNLNQSYNQWKSAVTGYGATREMDISKIATMPKVLTTAADVSQARTALSLEAGRLFTSASDWDWNVPDILEGYEDEFKAADNIKDKAEAGAKIALYLKDYADTRDVMDDDEADYLDMVLTGWNILNKAQSKIDLAGYDPRLSGLDVDQVSGAGAVEAAAEIDPGGELSTPKGSMADLLEITKQTQKDRDHNLQELSSMVKRGKGLEQLLPGFLSSEWDKYMQEDKKFTGKAKYKRKFYTPEGK